MHTACITSCIHVTKNSNNALPLLALRRASHMQLLTFSGFVTRTCRFNAFIVAHRSTKAFLPPFLFSTNRRLFLFLIGCWVHSRQRSFNHLIFGGRMKILSRQGFCFTPQMGINRAEFLLVEIAETKSVIFPSFQVGWVLFSKFPATPPPTW